MTVRWCFVALSLVASAVAGCDRQEQSQPPDPQPSSSSVAASAAPAPSAAVAQGPTQSPAAATGPAAVVSRGDSARRLVALTFDAGADVGFAAQILDVLRAAGIRATFGMTGQWAEQNPDLVVRIAQAGHQLVNHTYSHRSFTGTSSRPAVVSAEARRDELVRTEDVVRRLTGQTTKPWFRPPFGDYDRTVNEQVGSLGYAYNVLWTVDSLGWQGLSAEAITARCLRGAEPGAIFLFHVGAASQDTAALPGIVAGLREAGYGFGTVAEVVQA
jgi:peptidoglycan/xylan/chitin deacetylase (PgdA/CDA1 family)